MDDLAENTSCEEMFARISDDIDISSKYISLFIDETELSLDDLNDTLLALEQGGHDEQLKLLMSVSHRIKGSAASVGLNRAAKMAHLMEDILQQLVEQGEAMTPQLTDAMLQCTDGLRAHLHALKQGPPREDQFSRLASELALAQSAGPPSPHEDPLAADAGVVDGAKKNSRGNDGSNRPAETLRVDIARLDRLMNLAGELVINKARFARIGERLGELANSNRWAQATGGVSAETEKTASLHDSLKDLADAIHQLNRVSDAIQKSVMDTRMVAIGPLFNRFKRVVRDITRGNGKNVRLSISGEKTELDKRMVDELADPLIHMVRNAADHGIEDPRRRESCGKPSQGTISLSAFQRGNSIHVQVTDDGRGMDIERIAKRAVKRGLASAADIGAMSPRQIAQLAWEPGLSTADTVTEVSGRGMGMDIVRSKIEDLNGSIDLDTAPGRGTTITVKLPLTLAILPSLMVEFDGDVLAMPLESVAEIVSLDRREVKTLHGKSSVQIRGRVISLVRLDEVFDWQIRSANAAADDRKKNATAGENEPGNPNPAKDDNQLVLVVVAECDREIALVVDRVVGEEDIVIKSMADNYRNVAGISGASILGNGRVSLILDIAALIEMCLHTSNANNDR